MGQRRFFRTLGVRPLLGRLLDSNSNRAGCNSPSAVISYAFWQREFGGDSQIIGKSIPLEGHKFDISGVTPVNFYGVKVGRNFDVAMPVCAEPIINCEQNHLTRRRDWVAGNYRPIEARLDYRSSLRPAKFHCSHGFENTMPQNYRPDQVKYYVKYKLAATLARAGVSSLREQYQEPLILL